MRLNVTYIAGLNLILKLRAIIIGNIIILGEDGSERYLNEVKCKQILFQYNA